jgi:hypothetical protein
MSNKISDLNSFISEYKNLKSSPSNYSNSQIADMMNMSLRSLQRKIKSAKIQGLLDNSMIKLTPEVIWPDDWNFNSLVYEFKLDEAETFKVLDLIERAKKRNNFWVIWYIKNKIKIKINSITALNGISFPNDILQVDWSDLIAGLPVLGKWISLGEFEKDCINLRETIIKYSPFIENKFINIEEKTLDENLWNSKRRLANGIWKNCGEDIKQSLIVSEKAYGSASRIHVRRIKAAIDKYVWDYGSNYSFESLNDPFIWLVEFSKRLPMPVSISDLSRRKTPKDNSKISNLSMDSIIMNIIKNNPPLII